MRSRLHIIVEVLTVASLTGILAAVIFGGVCDCRARRDCRDRGGTVYRPPGEQPWKCVVLPAEAVP